MHHKFVVRDATDVWSGSTNWTDDSWSRQENVIVRVLGAPALARAFTLNLDELWERGTVEHTGRVAAAAGRSVERGDRGAAVVHARSTATRSPTGWRSSSAGRAKRIRIASPVSDLRPDPRHARRDRERAPLRRRRRDRRDPGRRGVPPVGDERGQRLEDPAAEHGAHRGAVLRQAVDPVDARVAARLHARQGRRRRRRRLRRLVQLLALGRAERRERARDPRSRRSPTVSRPSSTTSGRAIRARRRPGSRVEPSRAGCRDGCR